MKKTNIYAMTTCAIMTALMCILGPMSIPIGAIPITLTNFVIYLTVYLIGTRDGCISFILYLLLGLAGLPVFSGYQGGPAKMVGPTGGYLIGFIPMLLVTGLLTEKTQRKTVFFILGGILGTLIAYVLGTAWFVAQMGCTIPYALTVCVFPFMLFDLGKIVLACLIGRVIRSALEKTNLIH